MFFLPSVGKRSYTENIKNEKSGTNFKRSKQAIKTDPYSISSFEKKLLQAKAEEAGMSVSNFCELLHLTNKLNRPRLRANGSLYAFEKFPFQFFEDIECLQAKRLCTFALGNLGSKRGNYEALENYRKW